MGLKWIGKDANLDMDVLPGYERHRRDVGQGGGGE